MLIAVVIPCSKDIECDYQLECVNKKCQKKSVFPLVYYDGLAFALAFFASAIAKISGLGGGVFYTAGFILTLNLTSNQAVPISSFNVVCTSVFKFLWEIADRKRLKMPSTVRYDIAAMYSPAITVGSQFGVWLNLILRPWMLSILLFLIIMMSSFPAIEKGRDVYRKEKLENQKDKQKRRKSNVVKEVELMQDPSEKNQNEGITVSPVEKNEIDVEKFGKDEIIDTNKEDGNARIIENINNHPKPNNNEEKLTETDEKTALKDSSSIKVQGIHPKVAYFFTRDKRLFPLDYFAFIIVCVLVLFVISLLKGRNGTSVINTVSCTATWWSLSFVMIPISCIIIYILAKRLSLETKERQVISAINPEDPIVWNLPTIAKMVFFGLIVGVISSLLGVGGAFLTVPILLKFGLSPQISSSTASFVGLLSSISSTIQYLIFNLLIFDYAIMTTIGSMIGSLSAMGYFLPLFRRKNKQSLIVVTLIIGMYLSAALNLYIGIRGILEDKKVDSVWKFKSICS